MKTVHMIGNAHLDPVWLWNWQEGYQENRATFCSVLKRMEEYENFIFTSSSAQFYEWIEKNEPDLFEQIRQRIREGRWKICGGWWIQPDANIPSGESFARQSLISQNYFMDKFGIRAKTGYCVDSFGHNAMLPQILRKSGMSRYVYMRPNEREKQDIPFHTFLWEAPDGSRVTAFRIPFAYTNSQPLEGLIERLQGEFQPGVNDMMGFYGVGNHGGGPTKQNIENILSMQKVNKEINIRFSDPDTFFDTIEENTDVLPVVREELQYHAPGCYSAVSMIKQKNRETENALVEAEKYAVLTRSLGMEMDDSRLTDAWKSLLFNQFHDTLAGSALESAYEEARNQLGEALTVAHRCKAYALNKISYRIDIPLDENTLPLVVFNPHSFDVCTPIEIENGMFANGIDLADCSIRSSEGEVLTHQKITPDCLLPNRCRLIFKAKVPALGYALYYICRRESDPAALEQQAKAQTQMGSPFLLENEFLKVTFSEQSGMISSLYDKKAKREVLSQACSAGVIDDSSNDTWGHRLVSLNDLIGEFTLTAAKVMDCGGVRKTVQMTCRYGNSALVQEYSLYEGERKLHVRARINWQEHLKALKLYFPLDLSDEAEASVEIPFGYSVKKKEAHEEAMQRWADISDMQYGLSIINDGKYAVDFTGNRIGVTVLRSPVYAHHEPFTLCREDEPGYSFTDQGISQFSYLILPHEGSWKDADVVREATVFNQKPTGMFETFHKGVLPAVYSAITVDRDNILLSALKTPLKGNGVILRFYETKGEETEAVICFAGSELKVTFGAFDIRTFRLENSVFSEVDLTEMAV